MTSTLDIQEILELLPHRYPLLLVDRVLELVPEKRILALKNVTISEPFFQGHFPGRPIMPGVMILEAMAQAGGILAYASAFQERQSLMYFMAIDNARFRKPVLPGDQLISEMTILKRRKKVMKIHGVATVNNRRVAEAEFLAALGELS